MTKRAPERSSRGMRKLLKPIVERKRRDRINTSLETLRMLLLEKRPNETLKNPKVQKVDILENTVQFIRGQSQSFDASLDDWYNFRAGYHECLQRAVYFFNSSQDISQEKRAFLSWYFASCLTQLQYSAPGFSQLQFSKSGGHQQWRSNMCDRQLQPGDSYLNHQQPPTANQLQSATDQHPHGPGSLKSAVHGHCPEPGLNLSPGRTLSLALAPYSLPYQPMRFAEYHVQYQPLSLQQPIVHDNVVRTNRTVEPQLNNDLSAQNTMVWRPWP